MARPALAPRPAARPRDRLDFLAKGNFDVSVAVVELRRRIGTSLQQALERVDVRLTVGRPQRAPRPIAAMSKQPKRASTSRDQLEALPKIDEFRDCQRCRSSTPSAQVRERSGAT